MPILTRRVVLLAVPLLHAGLVAAQEAAPAPKAFAAPAAAASLPSGAAGGIGQTTLALLVVLAAIFGIAWLARRLRGAVRGGGQGIEILAQAAVGPRERVVVVKVGAARLLIGVAPGRVSALHELPADAQLDPPSAPGARPTLADNFRNLMSQYAGKGGTK